MSDDRQLDPVTGDFVDAPGGAFAQCDVIDNQIAFSYLLPVGSWEGDPTLGHGFNDLARAQNTQENRNRLGDLARLAVQWLIDLGAVESVDVTVEAIGADGVAFEVDYYTPGSTTPRSAGKFLVPVGAG
jgi:phage gp46-like protein